MKRLTAFFSGLVQGVGFRATVNRVARGFQVAGFVRNLPDGRVELVAEGEEKALQEFLAAIRGSLMRPFIRDVKAEWTAAIGEFQVFSIRT